MTYAEVAKLEHAEGCLWHREDSCDCGAIERALASRIEAAKVQLETYRHDMPSEAFKAIIHALGA